MFVAHLMFHIIRKTQLIGSDKDNLHTRMAGKRLYKGMHGATEPEVTAETDGDVVKTTYLALDCQKVGKCLGRMGV